MSHLNLGRLPHGVSETTSRAATHPARELAPWAGLAAVLGVVTFVACVLTLAVPDLLTGPDAMNGSARGTALVVLLVGLPLLAWSVRGARRGSLPAALVWTGTTAYLVYNAVLLVFATPFNRAFLGYVAMLGLSLWTLVALSVHVWRRVEALREPPPRWVAVYIWVVVALNSIAWLGRVLPAVAGDDPARVLDGTGLTTNPVFVQDLAVWLPVLAWLGVGVWRADPRRVALAAAGMVFWVVESLGVGVDQWFGHVADPSSPVASAAVVPMFLVLAVVGLVPAAQLLRSVGSDRVRVELGRGSSRST